MCHTMPTSLKEQMLHVAGLSDKKKEEKKRRKRRRQGRRREREGRKRRRKEKMNYSKGPKSSRT